MWEQYVGTTSFVANTFEMADCVENAAHGKKSIPCDNKNQLRRNMWEELFHICSLLMAE